MKAKKTTLLLEQLSRYRTQLIIAAIVLLALFFRFWRIWSLPPGMTSAEAASGLQALGLLDGDWELFRDLDNVRQALHILWQTALIGVFGNNVWVMRLSGGLLGIAGVIATYFFTKELFSKRTAMLAAFFMASAPWAVGLARLSESANLLVLLVPLLGLVFARALKNQSTAYWLLGGGLIGIGFYAHHDWWLFALSVLIFGLFLVWRERPQPKAVLRPLALLGLTTFVALAPLVGFAYLYPAQVLGLNPLAGVNGLVETLRALGEAAWGTLLMFNLSADTDWRYNLAGAPLLNAFTGIMFFFGLLLGLRRYRDARYCGLLTLLFIALVPAVFALESPPRAVTAAGAIPLVYIFAALGTVELIARWRGVFPRNPAAYSFALTVVALLLGFSAFYNFKHYFVAYANAPDTYSAFNETEIVLSEYLNQQQWTQPPLVIGEEEALLVAAFLTHERSAFIYRSSQELTELPPAETVILLGVSSRELPEELNLERQERLESPGRLGKILAEVYSVNEGN